MRCIAFLLIVLGTLVALPELASAQLLGEVTDWECNAMSDCQSGANCQTTTFWAPFVGGAYNLKAAISCPNGLGCKYCNAKACLYDITLGQWVGEVASNNNDCTKCAGGVAVNIFGGHQYRLTVCKLPCGTMPCGENTEQCRAACSAYASVGR